MKQIRKTLLIWLILLLTVGLAACDQTGVDSDDGTLRVIFPADMQVLTAAQVRANAAPLTDRGADPDAVAAFSQQEGGMFYAAGEQNGVLREIMITRYDTEETRSIERLQAGDDAVITALQNELIQTFQSGGLQVLRKGEFQRTLCRFVFIDISGRADGQADALYASTVFNGVRYDVLYQTDEPMTDALTQECNDMLGSFEWLKRPAADGEETPDNPAAKATLVVALIVIFAAMAALAARMLTLRKKSRDHGDYRPQFTDEISSNNKKKGGQS